MRRNRIAVPGILLMGLGVPDVSLAADPLPIECEMPGDPDALAACLCDLRRAELPLVATPAWCVSY